MFDPISTQTSSVNCAGLDFFDSAVDFNDLAFLNMVLCMQESDSALAAKMGEIRLQNELKTALSAKISCLNTCLKHSSAKDQDDLVYVQGGLENPVNPEEGNCPTGEAQRDWEKSLQDAKNDLNNAKSILTQAQNRKQPDPNEVGYCQHQVQEAQNKVDELSSNMYRRQDVEAELEKLRGQLEDMNSSSSIMMIDLQRLMNKRNEASQLVSNIESKSNQTAMGIISNFK
ncbi:MAG TPA: hypothetical protein VM425_18935 [Myxococcota bacterium]|nr:hypothetical protein [Myxococcota bacterium]